MLVALTITLGACGGKNTQPIEPATEVPADSSVQTAAPTTRGGLSPQEIERRDAERRRKALLEQRTIYFDYDSTSVRREFEDQLRAHGQELRDNRNSRVRLEGHADERGSREYNIGLGERRAQEVRRLLMLSGASATQITTISYGEERPNAIGNDESAWSQNRRVELIVR
ncbi:MAG: peptidoglycan-associated lipoprotein Pal [Pseudomonadota bacterium]